MVFGCKLIGGVCILGAAIYGGLCISQTFDERYWQLRHIYSILLQLKSELEYLNTTLPECFISLGEGAKEPVKSWLLQIGEDLEKKEGEGFSDIWLKNIDMLYDNSALRKEDICFIKELGDKLGIQDGQSQSKAIEYTLLQLERNRTNLEKEMKEKKKVITTIAMFLGFVTLIVLL
ncbi:MAG: stage III sporulation protein AB [Lachnospiraceae bacterium]